MTDIYNRNNGTMDLEKKNGILNATFIQTERSEKSNKSNNMCSLENGISKTEEKKVDPFAIVMEETGLENEKSNPFMIFLKFLGVIFLLYVFICSLDFMASAFRMIGGRTAGAVFQNSYISNPVVGLMMGILVTVLVQSSSTSTSIIVSMVNADILHVREAIPMIMGSNIGTSVTNTIVSITQIGDRNQFRRAFAGATVHDMFNWITVILMVSIEVPTHMLEKLTDLIVNSAFSADHSSTGTKIKLLKHLTEPITKLVVQIDKKTLNGWSLNDTSYENKTLNPCFNTKMDFPDDLKLIEKKCGFLFAKMGLDDTRSGIILLIVSLFLLCCALILIVKILNSMLKGTIAKIIKKTINADIPYVPWLTGYIAIVVGAIMTFIVQSSSIFTSALTPLIGLGLISVDRSYPLTLGSNIGTTTTALLASIAGEGIGLKRSVQIALVHLLFNIIGILIFYPIPFMRWPIPMAKALGNITADYRWFAIAYLFLMFFILPGTVFALTLSGTLALQCVGIPFITILLGSIVINVMQNKAPRCLPPFLRTWNWLPLPLRSLEPYDRLFLALPCCKTCRISKNVDDDMQPVVISNGEAVHVDEDSGHRNPAFDQTESIKL